MGMWCPNLHKVDVQLDIGENQYDPMKFVEAVRYSEERGFRTAWLGDHFVPWYHSANRSAFVWSVLGVALDRTSSIRLGPLVTTPMGARYHPAIVAQASATLDNMYPGRFLLGVGSGEALNERPFWNDHWPVWKERMERLVEGLRLVKNLWEAKHPFSFSGKYFGAEFYYLYTKPKGPIPIYFSAIGKRSAYFAGRYADTLVTICPRNNLEKFRGSILPEFRRGLKRRKGGVQAHVSFSFKSPSQLRKDQPGSLGWLRKDSWSIKNPVEVEHAGKHATDEEIRAGLLLCKGWPDLVKELQKYVEAGATEICLSSGADKERIREIGENVLSVF
jgi:coenzyme F420-dependent glucose-6-phosphate dehydrogenase